MPQKPQYYAEFSIIHIFNKFMLTSECSNTIIIILSNALSFIIGDFFSNTKLRSVLKLYIVSKAMIPWNRHKQPLQFLRYSFAANIQIKRHAACDDNFKQRTLYIQCKCLGGAKLRSFHKSVGKIILNILIILKSKLIQKRALFKLNQINCNEFVFNKFVSIL